MLTAVLSAFGLDAPGFTIEPFGPGLINYTFKVSGNGESYILQRLNTAVFKSPEAIAENLRLIDEYLKKHAPGYLFAAPLAAINGDQLIKSTDGGYYRLLPFVKGSNTVNAVENEKQAFEAARQFGEFSRLLSGFDIKQLNYTLPDFHNLNLRYAQFEAALKNSSPERLKSAETAIADIYRHQHIIKIYDHLTEENQLPLRVIHHDTKINNVLFDENDNGLCVIDLDTVMPGYFLSDVGDMMRTYLSPANEEETDLDKIHVHENIFNAVYTGYMHEMGDLLSETEKRYFIYSGEMMVYMQALRFLTDFLNNDVYYGSKYPGHNLIRAENQLRLLDKYIHMTAIFK